MLDDTFIGLAEGYVAFSFGILRFGGGADCEIETVSLL